MQQVRWAASGAVQLKRSVLGAATGDAGCSHTSKLIVKQNEEKIKLVYK